jgi:hypothetical protein
VPAAKLLKKMEKKNSFPSFVLPIVAQEFSNPISRLILITMITGLLLIAAEGSR